MNAREGMRRIGLVMGGLGAIIGSMFAWTQGSEVLTQREHHKQFQLLVSTPLIQSELTAIKTAAATKPKDAIDPDAIPAPPPKGYVFEGPWVYYSAVAALSGSTNGWPVKKNERGISTLYFNNNVLTGIEREDHLRVNDVPPPPVMDYVWVISLPLIGFLLPWGTIKLLTWIGTGFFHNPVA